MPKEKGQKINSSSKKISSHKVKINKVKAKKEENMTERLKYRKEGYKRKINSIFSKEKDTYCHY